MFSAFLRRNRSIAAWLSSKYPCTFNGPDCVGELKQRILADIHRRRPKVVLEVGGIDRPLLRLSPDYRYVGLDIESRPKCELIYDEFFVQSIENPVLRTTDMVISCTLLEHVRDNKAAVRSIFMALNAGGTTHHYIPSRWHPYSIALQLVGPQLQKRLIALLYPGAEGLSGYPAYFDCCSPAAMAALFRQQGFQEVQVRAFYRAAEYFAFFLPAYLIIALFENLCAALNARSFSSGFIISAVKPIVQSVSTEAQLMIGRRCRGFRSLSSSLRSKTGRRFSPDPV